jgi:hypothetical protein
MHRFTVALIAMALAPALLSAQSKASGLVFSLETGEPVPGATVELKDGSGLAVPGLLPIHTDQLGSYEFRDLAPGNYQLRVGSLYRADDEPLLNVLVSSVFRVDDSAHVYVALSELAFRSELSLTKQLADRDLDFRQTDRVRRMFYRSSMKDDSGRELLTASWAEDLTGATVQL